MLLSVCTCFHAHVCTYYTMADVAWSRVVGYGVVVAEKGVGEMWSFSFLLSLSVLLSDCQSVSLSLLL